MTTSHAYASPQAVTDASGAVIASYVYGGDSPLAKTTSGGIEYFLTDAMGSVIGKADVNGIVLSTIDYDGFGNARGAPNHGTLYNPTQGIDGFTEESSYLLSLIFTETYVP